mgnify:CR=1 FL=1
MSMPDSVNESRNNDDCTGEEQQRLGKRKRNLRRYFRGFVPFSASKPIET